MFYKNIQTFFPWKIAKSPNKNCHILTKRKIDKHSLSQDYHTPACFSCYFCLCLLSHSFYHYHSFVIACITWYLNHESPLHIYILLSFEWRQISVCLQTIVIFKWSRIHSVRKNQGIKGILRKVIGSH